MEGTAPKEEAGADAPAQEFSLVRWKGKIEVLAAQKDEIQIDDWTSHLNEILLMFKQLSSALYIAFKDVSTKAATIQSNKRFFNETLKEGDAAKSLQSFITKELELGVTKLNGKHNKKLVKDKISWQYTYTSTARTVTRNLWLLDFLYVLMSNLADDATATLPSAVKEAYSQGLGPHHPWILRKAAGVAMIAVMSRETFEKDTGATIEDYKVFKDCVA